MTKYNVRPLVAQEIEISTGTTISATWCRYFISITLHQCYIEATWKTRPKSNLDGYKETFNSLQEYLDWFANLKKTYGRRISRKRMVYAAYDETMRTFSYKPYENWATRRSKEKLNKPNNEPLLADDMIFQYTNIYNAIEKWESDKRETQLFDSLAASELIRQLNK